MPEPFRDPVHNFIPVDVQLVAELIQTREFQRLRRVRQLGTSYVTYHGAEHTRFTHSLGVMHVMQRVLQHLRAQGTEWEPLEHDAVVAAALLHDIGHGPFSHVWEHVVSPGKRHEQWTREIISGSTEVNQVLSARDAALPKLVLAILGGLHPTRFLCSLVAGQLDADRMDYLLRDSWATGTGYGRFDLERVIQVLGVRRGQVVVHERGLHNVEEYILARYFMYWQVYLHRTTRAQEVMLKRLLTRAKHLLASGGESMPCTTPLWSFLGGSKQSLEDYLAVDDHDVWFAIKQWATAADPVLKDLASRFLNRRLFKPVFRQHVEDARFDLVDRLKDTVAKQGFDPEYYLALDRTSDVPYDYYLAEEADEGDRQKPSILIVTGADKTLEISKRSEVINALASRRRTGQNIYVPDECRDAVKTALEE